MKKPLATLFLGIGLAGCMMGYLTGVSETSIAGTVVSSVFGGLIGLAAGYFSVKSERETHKAAGTTVRIDLILYSWGIALAAFSFLFVVGTFLGGSIREYWMSTPRATVSVPWTKGDPMPRSSEEAWNWLSFSVNARALGLSPQQIRMIYLGIPSNAIPTHAPTGFNAAQDKSDTAAKPKVTQPFRGGGAGSWPFRNGPVQDMNR